MNQEHEVNCELFDGGNRCSCKASNPLFVADEHGVRPMMPVLNEEAIREEHLKFYATIAGAPAPIRINASADWWIGKMREIIGNDDEI